MPKPQKPKLTPVKAGTKLSRSFFTDSVLNVAPALVGKVLCRKLPDGTILRYRITETEAYNGESDSACHARFGRTSRTSVMYTLGGHVYIYLCYGVHWMLNLVTGPENHPEAVLIRGIEGYPGPGKLTKCMSIDNSLNGIDMIDTELLWVEDDGYTCEIKQAPRIGINYASEKDKKLLWRFIMK